MPLQAPNLDNRTFEDLLNEARLRIPTYTPDWTDFNDSDPGMTLVQLFAWFTELMLHQFNQVPDLHYIKFLQMLNLEQQPARPAKTHVVFTPSKSATKVVPVNERTRFNVPATDGSVLFFETTRALDLCPYLLDSVQVFDGANFTNFSKANEVGTQKFRPLGWSPQPGSALYLGFKPPEKPDATPAFPAEMIFRFFLPPASPGTARAYSGKASVGKPSQHLVWEYRSSLDQPKDQPVTAIQRWRQLAAIDDQTLALTREGDFLIRGPGVDIVVTPEGKLTGEKEGRYWLRLRLADGVYSNDQVPEIAFVRTNVVEVENLATIDNEEIGQSDGSPKQKMQLRKTPVAKDSLDLVVAVPGRPDPDAWIAVADFLGSTRQDPHYTLNPTSGEIQFGDGDKGRVPEPGGTVIARKYLYGGGGGGNVKADTITAPPASVSGVEAVTNPRAAIGGKDEEPLPDLLARAPRALRGDGRAVTTDDFRRFAEEVPGVLKAEALSGYHPEYPGYAISGTVTVVIVPDSGTVEPKPSQQLRELVYSELDKVRLVTTEVFVAEPRYRRVEVEATVAPAPNASAEQVKTQLEELLKNFFQPANWSFGKKFYPSALYELLLSAVDSNSKQRLIQGVDSLIVRVGGEAKNVGEAVQLDKDELPVCAAATVKPLPEEERS